MLVQIGMSICPKQLQFLIIHRRSHIFDGKTQSTEIASFQLCDIQDPTLVQMIGSEEELRDVCNVSHMFCLNIS